MSPRALRGRGEGMLCLQQGPGEMGRRAGKATVPRDKPSAAQAYLGGTSVSGRLSGALLTPSPARRSRAGGLISSLGARLQTANLSLNHPHSLYFQHSPVLLRVTALPSYVAGGCVRGSDGGINAQEDARLCAGKGIAPLPKNFCSHDCMSRAGRAAADGPALL